jgi:hypothetical protein
MTQWAALGEAYDAVGGVGEAVGASARFPFQAALPLTRCSTAFFSRAARLSAASAELTLFSVRLQNVAGGAIAHDQPAAFRTAIIQ